MQSRLQLEPKKDYIAIAWSIRRLLAPAQVRIPLETSLNDLCRPVVRVGQPVLLGEKIAEPLNEMSTALHASISGKISAIGLFDHPLGGQAPMIEITSDGEDRPAFGFGTERAGHENLSAEALRDIFQDSGLVDQDFSMTPLHCKTRAKIQTLVLNACEDEPYVTCDHAMMMSHPLEILKGAEILRKAAGAEKVVIVTTQDKTEPAETLKSKIYFLKWDHVEVQVIAKDHPLNQHTILPRVLKAGAQTQAEVFNLATAFSVYEAVVLQKPLTERVITVAGECIIEPKNVYARIGVSLNEIIKACRGFLREPRKVLLGGPMKGAAQSSVSVPVLKGSAAILGLPKEVAKPEEIQDCVRCARCVEACPVDISPVMITLASENDLFAVAEEFGASSCVECGNCSYVCPSKRPMLELIRYSLSSKETKINPLRAVRAAERLEPQVI